MRLTPKDLKDMNLLKYYRLVRRWACKTYNLTDADLELLIYLDCKDFLRVMNLWMALTHIVGIKTDGVS